MSNLFKQRTARTTMTLFLALFTTVVAWAESLGLQGDGSQNNPFLIENTDDWVTFAEMINNGQNADAYYKLENDLTLGSEQDPTSLIVGIDKTHCFKVPMFEIPKKCTAPAYADGWTLSGVSTPAAVAAPRCFS